MNNENKTQTTEEPIQAYLTEDERIIIKEERKTEVFSRGYYGEFVDGDLILKPVEALLLLERKRIQITDSSNSIVDFKKLVNIYLQKDKNIWTKYLVYRDLRSRGYTVGLGYESDMDFRVYERGAKPNENTSKYLVYVVEEGKHLPLTELERIISIGISSRKKTALAVVDRQGDVTYYFVSQVNL
ncbi:MAG: tRNA-intron lyase [Candidatus Odinarchaeia archaeon]